MCISIPFSNHHITSISLISYLSIYLLIYLSFYLSILSILHLFRLFLPYYLANQGLYVLPLSSLIFFKIYFKMTTQYFCIQKFILCVTNKLLHKNPCTIMYIFTVYCILHQQFLLQPNSSISQQLT